MISSRTNTNQAHASRRAALAALGACGGALALPLLAASPAAPSAALSAPAKPTHMPAFALPTTAGTMLRSESLRGQVVIVRFWASW